MSERTGPTAGRLRQGRAPRHGDELRRRRLHAGDTSLLFRTLGRDKRSVTVDLRRPEGRDIVRALAARSDVLLENFRPGTLEGRGLGPDELRACNPRLAVVRVSAPGDVATDDLVGYFREEGIATGIDVGNRPGCAIRSDSRPGTGSVPRRPRFPRRSDDSIVP